MIVCFHFYWSLHTFRLTYNTTIYLPRLLHTATLYHTFSHAISHYCTPSRGVPHCPSSVIHSHNTTHYRTLRHTLPHYWTRYHTPITRSLALSLAATPYIRPQHIITRCEELLQPVTLSITLTQCHLLPPTIVNNCGVEHWNTSLHTWYPVAQQLPRHLLSRYQSLHSYSNTGNRFNHALKN